MYHSDSMVSSAVGAGESQRGIVFSPRFLRFTVCSTKARHTREPSVDCVLPKREEVAVERKIIMVPNAAYNVFRSNSYVCSIENACQPLAPEIKPAQPQPSSTQLDVPPRIKRVS